MTKASSARRARRKEVDPLRLARKRLAEAKSGKLPEPPVVLAEQSIRRTWREAISRASQATSMKLEPLYRLELRDDPNKFAEVELSAPPFAVRVGRGAPSLLYCIARLIASRTILGDAAVGSPYGTLDEAPDDGMVERLNRALFWYSLAPGTGVHQDFPITAEQALFGGMLTEEALTFLFCHEIAHGLLETTEGGAQDPDIDLAPDLAHLPSAWRAEFMADRLGLRLALGGRPHRWRNGDMLAAAYAGFELSLLLQREWERYTAHHRNQPYSAETHPPAADRLDALRANMAFHVGNESVGRVIATAEAVSALFISQLDNALTEDSAWERRQRDQIRIERIHELADECSSDIVPDYYNFIEPAKQILRETESFVLLDFALRQTAIIRGEAPFEPKEYAVAKLVGRACEDLDEPYFSVFKRITEFPDVGGWRARS